jgi:hypothetical protein
MRKQERRSVPEPVIPTVNCLRCQKPMRFTIMEPATVAALKVDTLVFECDCGFVRKQPANPPP